MKTLSIDIETYSSAPLSKCGVYKYAESSDFEILLFGCSADGGPVRVVDLACGEELPPEIAAALTDEAVVKWAFNANFERVCLSRFLGRPAGAYLGPAQWRCSMVWAAAMGLPLSLEGTGAVLGLEKQKLTEGKELIKYFCRPCAPTKTNAGRTRNRPVHAPDKWAAFKRYNARDVETEMSVQARLSKFPVPESVWEEYHLDQEINDRGAALDLTLVRQAIAMDARSRRQLTAAMKELTELDNPNSVQQMKRWLAENGLETDTLGRTDENRTGTPRRRALPPTAACQILGAEISGDGDRRLRRRTRPRHVPVLRRQPNRALGRPAHSNAKPAAEPPSRPGAGPRAGAPRRL